MTIAGPFASTERRLPLRVAITDGEAFDSWIESLARRNGVGTSWLLPRLGLPSGALYAHHALVARTPSAVLRRIERQAGLDHERLDAAVFERYQQLGWSMLDGSRFCPACLGESTGRWLLRWRLPWVFACQRHGLLLVDTCPGCGLAPRRRPAGTTGLLPPASCPNLIRRGQLCGTDLRTVAARALPVDGQLGSTQRWISEHLAIVENATAPDADSVTMLADLDAVAQWRRLHTTVADYEPFGLDAAEQFTAYLARGHDGRRPRHGLFTDSVLAGATATFARDLLLATDEHDIRTRLQPLTQRPNTTRAPQQHRTVQLGNYHRWTTLSPSAQSRFLTALDTGLAPVDRLRYRSCLPVPRLPQPRCSLVAERSRHIPQMLWPHWAVRLTPNPSNAHPDSLRAAMAACLLTPGRFDKTARQTEDSAHTITSPQALEILRRVIKRSGDDVLIMLCRLADHLDTHGAAIDYQRRRTLITADLLTPQQWRQLCRKAMTHPGKGKQLGGPSRRYLVARRYLFHLLTGADLNDPRHALAYRDPGDRSRHLGDVEKMNTPLRSALHEHAASHLAHLGIHEPLTWSPPADLAAGLNLPGRDPDNIDRDQLHHLVIAQGRPLRHAARELGTTLEHVRLVVEDLQREPGPWAERLASARRLLEGQRRAVLTREFFDREMRQAGKSRSQLSDETAIPIKEFTRYAKQAGVTLPGSRPLIVDPAWLARQYLDQRRSTADIGGELGVDAQTVTHTARRYGIPVRAPGIQSHPDLIIKLGPNFPPDLRHAVEGQLHGWQRLKRFQQAMPYPSLKIAADRIGAEQTALTSQFHRLERDIGTQLFHRATPTQPQRLTPRGALLLAALDDPRVRQLLERNGRSPRKPPTRTRSKKRPNQREPARPSQ